MSVKRIVTTTLAACAAVVICAVPGAALQAPHPQHPASGKVSGPAGMAKCEAMMAEHEKMTTDIKAADRRLDDLVTKMNTASSAEKAASTAAVVNELVTQRRTMRDGMMKMQHAMMGHMMEHMQAGKASMALCPMMKSMGDMKH